MPGQGADPQMLVDTHPRSPAGATELLVVRHGETIWNEAGRQQGHLDSPLNAMGLRQAEAIAERLAGEQITTLYSSDLGRARATAEIIAGRTGHRVQTDARFRERHLGIFQGLTMAEVVKKYPEAYARFRSDDPDYAIPQGESVRERYQQHVAAAADIAARHAGERVVIVGHGGVLSSLFRHTLSIPLAASRAFKLFNASFNTFFVEEGAWMLGTWGDISHLAGIGTADDR